VSEEHSKQETAEHYLQFTVVFEKKLEPDRLDEWLSANFPEANVQVRDLDEGKVIHDGL